MAKEHNDRTPAEEYFAHLDWQSKHRRRRIPSRSDLVEPRWLYKIIPGKDGRGNPWIGVLFTLAFWGILITGVILIASVIFEAIPTYSIEIMFALASMIILILLGTRYLTKHRRNLASKDEPEDLEDHDNDSI